MHFPGADGLRYLGPLEAWAERRAGEAGALHRAENPSREGRERERPPLPQRAAAAYAAARSASGSSEPTAGQAMHAPALCIGDAAPLREADRLLRGVGHLPVLGAEGTLIGVISRRDLSRLRAKPPRSLSVSEMLSLPVREFMASPVLAVGPETDLHQAVWMLLEKKVGCLPVVDAPGSVLGILTRTDLLRALVKHPSLRVWA